MQTPVWVMSTARSPLNHKEGAELKKQHKAESWEAESHTHSVLAGQNSDFQHYGTQRECEGKPGGSNHPAGCRDNY